jgi:hypothetical protein
MPPRGDKGGRRADNKGRVEPEFLDEALEPWDRQPREGDKAWQCFQLYRDAEQEGGIGKRTHRAVSARAYPGSPEGAKAKNQISDWSVRWRWMERCEAFDRHLDQVRQAEFSKEAKRDGVQALALLRAMRAKAGQAIIAMQPLGISPSEATRMADVAIVGIRREAGLATEITSTEKDNAFAEWLTRGGDPDDEEADDDAAAP